MRSKQTIRAAAWDQGEILCFGPFRLTPAERKLERGSEPVRLGDRAFDILLLLAANPAEVVTKTALLENVWPDLEIDEGNLRFQIAMIRRALGEGATGERYLATVQGRGYCFVTPISRAREASAPVARFEGHAPEELLRRHFRIIGRDDELKALTVSLLQKRFVSIAGPGGIGKTTLAVAVSHALSNRFDGEVRFLDLSHLSDPAHLATTLGFMFGLPGGTVDPVAGLVKFLKDKRMLLVFDSCEHVIEEAARITEALWSQAPDIHILATTRERLRVEGEFVHQLGALATPPVDEPMTEARLLDFPAAKLFIDRAAMTVGGTQLSDEECSVVADICTQLDGNPLAIELAAGRVHTFGVSGIATLLGEPSSQALVGRRTAPVRHQTMMAMFDWSHQLLTPIEAAVFRRLSAFVGQFSMDAAQNVARSDDLDAALVAESLASLVAKSLVTVFFSDQNARYRLLDTTRSYAQHKLRECSEGPGVLLAHAHYFIGVLQRVDTDVGTIDGLEEWEWCKHNIGNIRAALEWCFSDKTYARTGVELAAEAAAIFIQMSLWSECKYWSERALALLAPGSEWARPEMRLREAFALSALPTQPATDRIRGELTRGLEIAEYLGDRYFQLRITGALIQYYQHCGLFGHAVAVAEKSVLISGAIGESDTRALSDWFMGITLHLAGKQREAIHYCESADRPFLASRQVQVMECGGYDYWVKAKAAHARSLWLHGYCVEALHRAEETIATANEVGYPAVTCIALNWLAPMFIWHGNWDRAEVVIRTLLNQAERFGLAVFNAMGHGFLCELMLKRGGGPECLDRLRCHIESPKNEFRSRDATLMCALADGLFQHGCHAEGLACIDKVLTWVSSHGGEHHNLPEMLRVKGDLLAAAKGTDSVQAQKCFSEGLSLARRNGALSWELRLTLSLATLHQARGEIDRSRAAIRAVLSRFDRGQDSADLRVARRLLAGQKKIA
ncbi:MAG: Transcriptional regulator [Nevskia sp.]|nr:Transcriptional regulator [Nevskia sp.]